MRKLKLVSILIVTVLIGAGVASVSVAEKLQDNITLDLEQFITNVHPHINIADQNITIKVNVSESGNNTFYRVDDELKIDLLVNDNTTREMLYLYPRGVFYGAFAYRSITDVVKEGILQNRAYPGADKFLKRLIPIKDFGFTSVKEAIISRGVSDNITIDLDYSLSEDSYLNGETLTFTLAVMGLNPGNANGVSEDGIGQIIEHQKVELTVSYEEL